MKDYNIEFYSLNNGEEPAKTFIYNLEPKMKAKIIKILDMLQKNGPILRMPYSRFLGDGIFEIRAKSGTNISRILYFFVVDGKIILTNGFIKKTMKTPKSEIEKAKKYKSDYEWRREHDQL